MRFNWFREPLRSASVVVMRELNAAMPLGCFEVGHVANPEAEVKIELESSNHIIPPGPHPMAHPETLRGEGVTVGSHPHLIEQQTAVILVQQGEIGSMERGQVGIRHGPYSGRGFLLWLWRRLHDAGIRPGLLGGGVRSGLRLRCLGCWRRRRYRLWRRC